MKYYDTCALINRGREVFESDEKFYISTITFRELEQIKQSAHKGPDVKQKVRRLLKLLDENQDKYIVDYYTYGLNYKNNPLLEDNNDSKIIYSALAKKQTEQPNLIFVTDDACCKRIATAAGLKTQYGIPEQDNYKGYIDIVCRNDDELAMTYNTIYQADGNPFNLLQNEYFFIKDKEGNIIDKYKCVDGHYEQIKFISFDSSMFGNIKPKDDYQLIAMDAIVSNQIVKLGGPAGSGKSYLSLGYLFHELERGRIDKIIVFCNTVATTGAAKLGFYPGSKDEKLLDSQIGNFLAAKFGDKMMVEDLVDKGVLILLPMADIRGYDTTGMHAGVYITEAQNMDVEMMRLALQRIGEDSKCILDGDELAQVDLGQYAGYNNGLRRMSQVFRGENVYGEVILPNIYRSKIASIAQRM